MICTLTVCKYSITDLLTSPDKVWVTFLVYTVPTPILDYFASAITPHSLHFLLSQSFIHALMMGLSCVPRSVQWKRSSCMMTGI
jgi:Na+/H+ antiporter NhaB